MNLFQKHSHVNKSRFTYSSILMCRLQFAPLDNLRQKGFSIILEFPQDMDHSYSYLRVYTFLLSFIRTLFVLYIKFHQQNQLNTLEITYQNFSCPFQFSFIFFIWPLISSPRTSFTNSFILCSLYLNIPIFYWPDS